MTEIPVTPPVCCLVDCNYPAEHAFLSEGKVFRYCKYHHPSILLDLISIPIKEADLYEVMNE